MQKSIGVIWFHPKFRESYKTLPLPVKVRAEKREKIFRKNPFHPVLRAHKLKGRLADLYSFSVDAKYRILFRFHAGGAIFLDVGDHDIYR